MPTALRATPLASRHNGLGARMVEFNGWNMPLQYEGILAEHHATRSAVTVFDTCHMARFHVTGPGALDDLARLLTSDVRAMAAGQCRYGFVLREDGGVLDDLITYRLAGERWLVVANAGTRDKDLAWLRGHARAGTRIEDLTDSMGKLDVQGPQALSLVRVVLGVDLARQLRFTWRPFPWVGAEGWVSRTGYTGEDGVELYVDARQVGGLWDELLAAGARPAGLGARDTLRLEAGLPLYGHELGESITPAQARLERFAAKAEAFIGRAALQAELAAGPARLLCGFRIAGRQSARAGNTVLAAGAEVGRVTSGSFAPTLGCAIGFALVSREHAQPGTQLAIDTGRGVLAAELVPAPFYRRPRSPQPPAAGTEAGPPAPPLS